MMEGWRTIRLGNACNTNVDSYSPKEKWPFVNYLDTGNITDNRIDAVQHIDVKHEKLPSRARRKVRRNSIIYSTVRPNQRHFGIIKKQPDNFLVSTGFAVIDTDEEVLDADFLYYLLAQSTVVEKLHAIAEQSTSVYPSIKPSDIEDLEICIPDIEIQKQIAEILSSLDRKVEQNSEINKNLFQQSLLLFEHEYVACCTSSEEMPLYDFAEYINGSAFKPNELGDVGLPVIKIAELKSGITDSTKYFNGDKDKKYLVANGDILFSWSGNPETSIDIFIWADGNGILNQHTFNVRSKYGCPWFTYLLLKYYKPLFTKIASNKQTTGLGHVTAGDLKRLTFPFNLEQMQQIEKLVSPFMSLYYDNLVGNQRLRNLRDSLLPKLMSGEIEVSDINL